MAGFGQLPVGSAPDGCETRPGVVEQHLRYQLYL